MAEFFAMGGHGFFIWTSYAITVLVLLHGYLSPIRRRKNLVRELGTSGGQSGAE